MTTESVEIILSAKDNASSVIRQSGVELALLQDRVDQVSKGTAKGSEAVSSLARSLGGGWLVDAANQMKGLSNATQKATAALKEKGAAAIAVKAGLVGVIVFAGVKINQVATQWAEAVSDFTGEIKKATTAAEQLSEIFLRGTNRRLDKQISDLQEFGGTFDQQAKKAVELERELTREIAKREKAIKNSEELKSYGKIGEFISRRTASELKAAEARLERNKKETSELEERRNQLISLYSDEAREDDRKRNEQRAQKARAAQAVQDLKAMHDEMAKGVEEQEKKAEDLKKTRQKQAVQRLKEMHRETVQFYKDQERMRDKALQQQMKASAESIKAMEKEISDLESMKMDTNIPTLAGKDERMTSQGRGTGDIATQQLKLTERQLKIAEKQEKLNIANARHLKLIAEKEQNDATVSLVPGGL